VNDHIRKLAIQTDIWCDQNVAQGSPAYNNLWEHKFAELIVRECVEVVASRPYIDDGNWSHPSTMIRKHFGVEE
jgi:hypothetical protein